MARQVVLKWMPGFEMADDCRLGLPRGVPVPEYTAVLRLSGGTVSAQRVLPGRSQDNPADRVLRSVVEAIAAPKGDEGPPPAGHPTWGEFVISALTAGIDGWADDKPLRRWGARSAASSAH
jgi:hypothetical protein